MDLNDGIILSVTPTFTFPVNVPSPKGILRVVETLAELTYSMPFG